MYRLVTRSDFDGLVCAMILKECNLIDENTIKFVHPKDVQDGKIELTSNDITTHEEWLDGDIQPTFIRQQDGFKTINLTFLILCQEEEEAFLKISRLT